MDTTRTALPEIIQFLGTYDSGEYGNATCPHCGAEGRYVTSFVCADGKQRGAMAGCIQLYPVSPLAREHALVMGKISKAERAGREPKLNGWDTAILAACEDCYAGKIEVADALRIIADQKRSRNNWLAKKGYRR